MRCAIEPLTFELLDDIALGFEMGALAEPDLPKVTARDLGPLLELRHAGLLGKPGGWLDLSRHAPLVASFGNSRKWFHPTDHQGFVSVGAIQSDYTNWTDFAMRAKRAAAQVGFAADEGGQLVAAMGELRSNIEEHSQRDGTGYIAYDATPGKFEFVVGDMGIGILQSLRTHRHYASVSDAGTALRLALTEGVSRFHDDKDRGKGFRPIFVGLANASRQLRFRTVDHSHEFVRDERNGVVATTRQKALIQGFFCSAICIS